LLKESKQWEHLEVLWVNDGAMGFHPEEDDLSYLRADKGDDHKQIDHKSARIDCRLSAI
jgi:hypothetical protein